MMSTGYSLRNRHYAAYSALGHFRATLRYSSYSNPSTAIPSSILSPSHSGTVVSGAIRRPQLRFRCISEKTVGWPRAVANPGPPDRPSVES